MKKAFIKLTFLAMCILLILSVTACAEKQPEMPDAIPDAPVVSEPVQPAVTETDKPEPAPEVDPVPDDDASPVIQSAVTDDEHFARFDDFLVFGDDEIEDYILWCDVEMTDFYITNIYYDEDGWLSDGKHLFDAETVPVGTAINYLRMVPEGFPTDAVIYTANGRIYMYAIGYNGRDGGISFMEIDKLTVDPDYEAPSYE